MYVICTIYHHPLIIVSSNYDILKYNHNSILFSITPLPHLEKNEHTAYFKS